MSSLAAQLAGIASIDASRLTSRTGAPSSKSYLFTPIEASNQDFDEVYQIALEGFLEILNLDPDMAEFEEELFSDISKRTDRMMLNLEDNKVLDEALGRCLRRLGKWIGVMACGKCIEWLVRRFRIHEMNAELVLQVFLPYHESPNFPRMLSILTIPPTSPYFAPLAPLIKDAQALPRAYIATAISPAKEPSLRLLNDVVGMVPLALKEDIVHRAMLNFWSATIVELLEKKNVSEGLVKCVVEAFAGILTTEDGGQDVNAAVYPPLVLLTRSIRLADGPFLALLSSLLTPSSGANPAQRTLTLLVLLDDRKNWTGGLGENASESLAKIKLLGETLAAVMATYGFAVALPVILTELIKRPDLNTKHLRPLIESPSLSPALVRIIADGLIAHQSQTSTESIKSSSQKLLSTLRQRHPSIVDKAIIVAGAQDSVPQLLRKNITIGQGFADVYAAEVADRIRGVGEMFDILKSGEEGNRSAAKEALLARLTDDDPLVIKALYDQSEVLVDVVKGDYIDIVRSVFTHTKTDGEIVKAHLVFIDKHLLVSYPEIENKLFEQIVFPCLLDSTLSKALTESVSTGGGLTRLELLNGLTSSSEGVSSQLVLQIILAAILKSAKYEQWTKFLLSRVESTCLSEAYAARLLLAQVLHSDTGDRAITLARDVVQRVVRIIGHKVKVKEIGQVESPTSDDLVHALPAQGGKTKLEARSWVCLLGSVAGVVKPKESVDWLTGIEKTQSSTTQQYRQIALHLYTLVNSGVLNAALASTLLRTLLAQLAEDALIFFASVWTSTLTSSPALRITALRHALAFINAYKSQGSGVDFQMMVPSLVMALQDENKEVRTAAVSLLRTVSSEKGKEGDVYAVDTFYGNQSKIVQLLKPSYLDKYLSALITSSPNIIIDPAYVSSVHTSNLSPLGAGNKKDKAINRAIIASLFSHISAWRSLPARMTMLRSFAGVSDQAVLKGVLPLLVQLINPQSEECAWLDGHAEKEVGDYLESLVGCLNKQSAVVLASPEGEGWKFFEGLLSGDVESRSAGYAPKIRSLVLDRMITAGVYDSLPITQRVSYLVSLIRSLHTLTSEERFATLASLRLFNLNPAAVIAVLTDLTAPLDSTAGGGGKKRQRQDDTSVNEGDKVELAIMDLTVILESRDWAALGGDVDLAAGLMGVLSALLTKRQIIKDGVDYLEQELLGSILSVLEKINDSSEVTKSHIGIEAIIKTIRSTSNPRTSQRALLVAAELARLTPDAVLHNVMPIFTFMGAADFQRDDAYSFGVVERTVKGIVPVLVGKLRETAGSGLELWNASANFLRIFTDMAGRLPKHRTLPFFAHLVDALGRTDYLAPVSMLLIDRTTVKTGKSGNSVAQAIELALGITAPASPAIKLNVILEIVKEIRRLLSDISNEETTAFLGQFSSENEDSGREIRRMTPLLNFSTALSTKLHSSGGKGIDQSQVQNIVRELVMLFGLVQTSVIKHSDVPLSTLKCLGESMKLLSAENFLSVVKELSESDDQQDIQHALDLFAERLPLIKQEVRLRSTAGIAAIVRRSADLLSASVHEKVLAGLVALRAVITSALPVEDSALAAVLPKLIDGLKGSDVGVLNEILSLLELSTRHLGPRIIPSIQSILTSSLSLINRPSSSTSTTKASFLLISSIIETVPTFIGAKQLGVVLRAAIDNRDKQEESSSALLSVCARKIPTKVLFPVVMELWKTVQSSDEKVLEGFFHLLRLTLKNADRAVLPSLLKTIFAFFLDVFDLRHTLQSKAFDLEVVNRVEESAIGSFLELVTKLNEASFKPLFTRLYDWAVIDLSEGKAINDQRLTERKTVLLHVMSGLLNKFRHLLSPYIGILLPHLEELLSSYASGTITDPHLCTLLIRTLGKSFEVDEGAYWTEVLYIRLIPLLNAQISIVPEKTLLPGSALSVALASLAGSTTSEPILKALNTGMCKMTRNENVRIRLAALRCMDAVWERQTDEMVGLVPETVSEYLAELIEDENKDVELLARGVLGRIERVTGSLKEYLE